LFVYVKLRMATVNCTQTKLLAQIKVYNSERKLYVDKTAGLK